MAVNRGLGKGFAALFSNMDEEEQKIVETLDESSTKLTDVDVTKVDNNPNQPRKQFEEGPLAELADSIREFGMLQPIILSKNGERYVIIAGERRFRAAVRAGLAKVPALIREYTPQQRSEIALVENLQREDLNVLESARAIKELMEHYGLKQDDVADRIKKSRPYVSNTLRLLTLPDEVLTMVERGELTAGHAKALVTIDSQDNQIALARRARDSKMSVRAVEDCARTANARDAKLKSDPHKRQPLSLELKDMVTMMQRIFATKVKLIGTEQKGRIMIDYFNSDDLDHIYEIVNYLSKNRDKLK